MSKHDRSVEAIRDRISRADEVMRPLAQLHTNRLFLRSNVHYSISFDIWTIGYQWKRYGSSRISGATYDVQVARGKTFEEALDKAKLKLKKG